MSCRPPNRQDLYAIALAAFTTLVASVHDQLADPPGEVLIENIQPAPAPDGLIDAGTAQATGAWLLDEPETTASMSFDPQHDRLVWRVSGAQHGVLLDAETGEALAFEFE